MGMSIGMLWFDNDAKTSLVAKVVRAADYYKKKYVFAPTLCLVNPANLVGTSVDFVEGDFGKLALRSNRAILPGHLWIGVEDKNGGG
jgi:hypothetical protein